MENQFPLSAKQELDEIIDQAHRQVQTSSTIVIQQMMAREVRAQPAPFHDFEICQGKQGGTVVFPGLPEHWPEGIFKFEHEAADFYGGYLVAESIPGHVITNRIVQCWNHCRGISTETLTDPKNNTAELLKFLRSVIVNGGGPTMKTTAVERIDAILGTL